MTFHDPQEDSHRFHHRLPSTFAGINEAVDQLTDFIKKIKLQTNYFALIFLIREALNNAVIHGNKMCPTKNVDLDILMTGANIAITIIDEGDGFQWRQIANRNAVQPHQTGGRGVYYLQQFGYTMHYNDKGNILYLHKELTGEPTRQ